jgi:hypothetical protein
MEKILTGDDVLLIKKTNIVRNYQSETEGFKDKSYRIYAFGDKAFTVHQDDEFHADFDKGNISKVLLTVTDEGLSLANYISWTRAIGQKRNQVALESISVENFVLGKQLQPNEIL